MSVDRETPVSLWDALDVTEYGPVRDMQVHPVPTREVDEFCKRWHYAHHGGAMAAWTYGLYDGPVLVGVVAYSIPTMPACSAYFGADKWEWVAHMGRLVCADDAPRNVESHLIAGSLKLFKAARPIARAVVTYAATGVGHIGYVYQATNALYCGTTAPDVHYIDTTGRRRTRKQDRTNVKKSLALSWGWTAHVDPPKHRYVYLLGNKTERKEARALLKFPVLPYPKSVPA